MLIFFFGKTFPGREIAFKISSKIDGWMGRQSDGCVERKMDE